MVVFVDLLGLRGFRAALRTALFHVGLERCYLLVEIRDILFDNVC